MSRQARFGRRGGGYSDDEGSDGAERGFDAAATSRPGERRPQMGFYDEDEEVTRSMKAPLMPGMPGSIPSGSGQACGRFVGGPAGDVCSKMPLAPAPYPSPLPPSAVAPGSHLLRQCETRPCIEINVNEFKPGDSPPVEPKDPMFRYELTVQYTSQRSHENAFEIPNSILTFLKQQDNATLVKLPNRQKFTIKAEVFVGSQMCTMKVRVYARPDSGDYAIEFQRRCGDIVAFNFMYQRACQHLRQNGILTGGKEIAANPLMRSMEPFEFDDDEGLTITREDMIPLIDMALLKAAPWLQAEAARTFHKMTEDILRKSGEKRSKEAELLLDNRVIEAESTLLEVNSIEVALPASNFAVSLLSLAREEKADQFISPLFSKIVDKMTDAQSHPQVRKKLSQELEKVVQEEAKAKSTCALKAKIAEHGSTDWEAIQEKVSTKLNSTNLSHDPEVMKRLEEVNDALLAIIG